MPRRLLELLPTRPSRLKPLQLPVEIEPETRVAQISNGLQFACARIFERGEWPALPAFAPDILVGYGPDFIHLGSLIERGVITAVTTRRMAFMLTDCSTRVSGQQLRDEVWRAFRVPLFEAIVAPGCRLLAVECEAHCGWHVQPGLHVSLQAGELIGRTLSKSSFHTGFSGALETLPCPCGRSTPRLRNLLPYSRKHGGRADSHSPAVSLVA